jgi:hypothetical protein
MRHPTLHEEPPSPGAAADRSPGNGDDVDHVEPRGDSDDNHGVRYESTARDKPGLVSPDAGPLAKPAGA